MAQKKPKKIDSSPVTGTLFVVATPIGNLEDITLRAIRILGQVSLIAAEDTRRTRKLLNHLGIKTPLQSYFKGNEVERSDLFIEKLQGGEDVAVVSDAGTPGISDPGGILVSRARECGIPVVPLPGPSAVIAALSASGFKDTQFLFLGFLPSKVNQRRQQLEAVAQEKASIVFYESPARVLKSLADCLKIFGDRRAVVARELTKIYEEFLTGSLGEIVSEIGSRETIKGEYVVIIEGASSGEKPARTEDLSEILKWYKAQGVSLSEAVKAISRDLGVSRSELYTRALNIWDSSG